MLGALFWASGSRCPQRHFWNERTVRSTQRSRSVRKAIFLMAGDTYLVHIRDSMKSHRTICQVYSPVLALVLLVAVHVAATSSLSAQSVPLEDTCLIYTTRSTSIATGYSSYSSSYTGLAVVGPEYTETVQGYGSDGQAEDVDVKKRNVLGYSLFTSSGKKYYSASPQAEDRIVGAINLAKAGSSKPSISIVLTFGGSASNYLSDNDTIGKASWKSPYPGVAPNWLATSLSTSYKFYDINPDRWENPNAPINYIGQSEPPYLPCSINSGKTTFALDAKRSQRVKGMTFEEACAALEESLEALGYERQ